MLHISVFANVSILFYGRDRQGQMFKVMKNNNLLNVFISYGNFPQVFGQVNDWSTLELDGIIRVLHMVAFENVFILFYVQDWERRIFKVTKNDNFLSIFVSLWLFAQNFGQVNKWTVSIKIAWNYKSASFSYVPNCFYFVWWSRLKEKCAQNYEKWSIF